MRSGDILDEFHHKATRTLFIGNLDKTVGKDLLRDTFTKFGHIVVSLCSLVLLALVTPASHISTFSFEKNHHSAPLAVIVH